MKKVIFMIMVALLALPIVQSSYANMEGHTEHIQVMRQAANELQASNPDLSKKLNDFADKKEKMKDKWPDEDKEKMLEQKREDLLKVRQASSELKGTNDDLAGELHDIADRWDKKLQEKAEHMKQH
jgi:hypothetical protein